MVEFKPMTDKEKKEFLENFDDYDWSENGGTEVRPIKLAEENDSKPVEPKLPDDLPAGITPPDIYHE